MGDIDCYPHKVTSNRGVPNTRKSRNLPLEGKEPPQVKMASFTEEQITGASTLSALAQLVKVDEQLWLHIKTHMGDPTFDEIDMAASIPGESWEEAILTVSPTAILKNVRVATLINLAFGKAKKETYQLFKPKAKEPVPSQTNEKQAPPSEEKYTMKIKLSKTIDQNLDQEIPLLPPEEIIERRQRFEAWNRQPPLPLEQTSDAQVSAYAWLNTQKLNCLWVDFEC